jgi:hypothetical protein
MQQGKFYEFCSAGGSPMGFIVNARLYEYGWAPEIDTAGFIDKRGRVIYKDQPVADIKQDKVVFHKDNYVLDLQEKSSDEIAERLKERNIKIDLAVLARI